MGSRTTTVLLPQNHGQTKLLLSENVIHSFSVMYPHFFFKIVLFHSLIKTHSTHVRQIWESGRRHYFLLWYYDVKSKWHVEQTKIRLLVNSSIAGNRSMTSQKIGDATNREQSPTAKTLGIRCECHGLSKRPRVTVGVAS